jgi:hypothetical protein
MNPSPEEHALAAPAPGELPPGHGLGPPFEVADLPAAPPFSLRNLLRVIGPGAILLATAIGGGEWLIGPAQAVEHSLSLFWIVTVAIVLQLVFNLEAARYTLYTGEPIYGGILRLWPGRRFWGGFYSLACFLQLGLPALAGLCAATLFSAAAGRLPETAASGDQTWLHAITLGLIVVVVAILHFGGTIERMLEYASWFMLLFIFSFLLVVNIWFIPWETWGSTLRGFLGLTPGSSAAINWALLGALAATAGCGGVGNLTMTNWMRDKGFGMGSLTGAIPSAVGSRQVKLSPWGKAFPANAANLARWRVWQRYLAVDQIWVWALFCFLGMFLNVNLVMGIGIPPGTEFTGIAAGAYQAHYLAERLWSGFWILTLLNGFWILFSTQLGNTDILVRTTTDVLWLSSSRLRAWRGGDIRRVYYTLLFAFSIWGAAMLWSASAADMFKFLGNMAGLVLCIAAVQVFRVNRRFLPRAVRPGIGREALLLAGSVFYGFFTYQWLREAVQKLVGKLP